MKHLSLLSIIFLAFCLASCITDLKYEGEKAVIDGWIDSDGNPSVIFTSSIVPGENNSSLADKIIRWGKVTISDGDTTIIMTGSPEKFYFPPYRYVTYQMNGEPGKTYKITADYADLHAEASCRMPEPTPILNIEVKNIEGNDSLKSAELQFVTPEICPAYYYVTMRKLDSGERFLPTMLGTYKATEPSRLVNIPIMHPKNGLSMDPFVPQLKIGEKLEIKLCRITEEVYEFWNQYDNAVLFGGSQFINSSNSIEGNISGGYGIWSAQGTSTYYLNVK